MTSSSASPPVPSILLDPFLTSIPALKCLAQIAHETIQETLILIKEMDLTVAGTRDIRNARIGELVQGVDKVNRVIEAKIGAGDGGGENNKKWAKAAGLTKVDLGPLLDIHSPR